MSDNGWKLSRAMVVDAVQSASLLDYFPNAQAMKPAQLLAPSGPDEYRKKVALVRPDDKITSETLHIKLHCSMVALAVNDKFKEIRDLLDEVNQLSKAAAAKSVDAAISVVEEIGRHFFPKPVPPQEPISFKFELDIPYDHDAGKEDKGQGDITKVEALLTLDDFLFIASDDDGDCSFTADVTLDLNGRKVTQLISVLDDSGADEGHMIMDPPQQPDIDHHDPQKSTGNNTSVSVIVAGGGEMKPAPQPKPKTGGDAGQVKEKSWSWLTEKFEMGVLADANGSCNVKVHITVAPKAKGTNYMLVHIGGVGIELIPVHAH